MDLCVVIPARNEEQRLPVQLAALLRQSWIGEWQVVVVDNGSTDGTANIVREMAESDPRLHLLVATEKADQSYAANAGVRFTDATAVAFCDADDIVVDGWVAAMGDALATHDVVTGPNELDMLNPKWLADSRGRSIENAVGSFAGIFPLVRGNNYGVRRGVWERVGPLREDWSRHGVLADAEFSLRCWMAGIEIVGVPRAVVHYRYRSGARELWRQGWNYGYQRPAIAKMLRDSGKPRPAPFGGWKSWALLISTLPSLVSRSGRARWLWIAGNRFGQVRGSIKHRVLMI